ncbi:MAG TPA: alkaline phosphatase family protein [Chloroflexota bacterium]|nr:alkaline phosphatase family protein [Chloroflexota bacterium]HUM69653.1 alkaline phosphatase family protein [Chloroflexota bacterium]
MTETLIIFVDSLPYNLLHHTSFLNNVSEKWAIEPGFGYSVNIHAELFAGLLPDDVGFFGEWLYNPAEAPGRFLKPVLPILDKLFRPYLLNRGLQRVLTMWYHPGHPMPNIPLRHLDKYALNGVHILSPKFPYPTIFTRYPNITVLNYRGKDMKKGERDQLLFEKGLDAIPQAASLFVPLPDLDGFGHRFGVEASPYLQHLNLVDEWCRQLSDAFLASYPAGHVFILSDHGMANVSHGVYLDIEEQLGPANSGSYLYFSDANLLRVWVFDRNMMEPIRQYLENFEHGHILTEQDRKEYGLTTSRFGDFIFVLHEQLAFQPSTFARNIPKGMHGYDPKTASQQGVALHVGPPWSGNLPRRMRDVYLMLDAVLKEELP